jgi:hypothetical protein
MLLLERCRAIGTPLLPAHGDRPHRAKFLLKEASLGLPWPEFTAQQTDHTIIDLFDCYRKEEPPTQAELLQVALPAVLAGRQGQNTLITTDMFIFDNKLNTYRLSKGQLDSLLSYQATVAFTMGASAAGLRLPPADARTFLDRPLDEFIPFARKTPRSEDDAEVKTLAKRRRPHNRDWDRDRKQEREREREKETAREREREREQGIARKLEREQGRAREREREHKHTAAPAKSEEEDHPIYESGSPVNARLERNIKHRGGRRGPRDRSPNSAYHDY